MTRYVDRLKSQVATVQKSFVNGLAGVKKRDRRPPGDARRSGSAREGKTDKVKVLRDLLDNNVGDGAGDRQADPGRSRPRCLPGAR